jgi:hypothetical protein
LVERQVGRLFTVRLLLPIRQDLQLFVWLVRIVGLHMRPEVVWTCHAFMHHELHRQFRALTGL